jgi:hypothetical protein
MFTSVHGNLLSFNLDEQKCFVDAKRLNSREGKVHSFLVI